MRKWEWISYMIIVAITVIGLWYLIFLFMGVEHDTHSMHQSQNKSTNQEQEQSQLFGEHGQYYYPGTVPGFGHVVLVPKGQVARKDSAAKIQ